jgi:arginine/ornithine N-succinyltransferase beta subunit|tara:strand:- start:522 stop:767 length:246 start_codon:yes stop_codon:yes gene_type:complete
MNRKFVKENKQVLREFIGKLLSNILLRRNKREIDKYINADPTLKKHRDDIKKLRKSMEARLDKMEKSAPEVVANLRKASSI